MPSIAAQPVDTLLLKENLLAATSESEQRAIKEQLSQLSGVDHAAAIRLSKLGVQLAASPTGKLIYLESLAFAYLSGSKFVEAEQSLDEAEALVKQEGLVEFLPVVYLNRGNLYWKTQKLDDGLAMADSCQQLSIEQGNEKMEAKSQMLRGWLLRLKGRNEEALQQFQLAFHFFEKTQDGKFASQALNGLAATHYLMENLTTCIEYYLQARDYASQNGLAAMERNIESNLGYLYFRLEKFEKAKAAMYRAFHLAEKSSDQSDLGRICYNLGELYIHDGQPDSARHFSLLALRYAEQSGDKIRMSSAYLNLSELELAEGSLEEAAAYSQRAVLLSEESGDAYTKGYSLFQQGKIDEERKRFHKASDHYKAALRVFEQTGELSWQSESTRKIALIEEQLGRPAAALAFFKKSQILKDSIQEHEQLQKIAAIEKQYEVEKKEEEIRHLAAQNTLHEANSRKNRFLLGVLLLALFLSVLLFVLAYRQRKLQLEKGLAEIKQQLLRQQMNPHFIFNSLNSVQNQFLKGDTESSVLLMGQFSKLMRLVLNNSNETFVPIHDELELLRLYLDLEQLRTNHKFEYVIRIDEEVDIYNVQLPSMVTQIFVENAIWHGIVPNDKKGKIVLHVSAKHQSTIFSIEDNGVGRKYSLHTKTESQKEHRSLGTHLVRERIQQINRKFTKNIRLLIKDLIGPAGEANGTKVELFF